jgi:hypothetical protein
MIVSWQLLSLSKRRQSAINLSMVAPFELAYGHRATEKNSKSSSWSSWGRPANDIVWRRSPNSRQAGTVKPETNADRRASPGAELVVGADLDSGRNRTWEE